MRILHLSFSDHGGGAAIAALRLTEALKKKGHEAVLGVVELHSPFDFVIAIPIRFRFIDRLARRVLGRLERFLLGQYRTQNRILHSLNFYSRVNIDWINASNFDLVHLHWINHDMLSVPDIGRITKPLVWTMHDSWPVCGAEHHPDCQNDDMGYVNGYIGKDSGAGHYCDLRRLNFRRKVRFWRKTSISFIAPSRWEEGILRSSCLFRAHENWRATRIPCIVDGMRFRPMNRSFARSALGLENGTVMVGLGSAYPTSDGFNLKGGHLIKPAIKYLMDQKPDLKLTLLVFGPVTQEFIESVGVPVFPSGFVSNEVLLNLLYNCCDTFLCPSIVESFGLTVLEAAFAGVPAVAFRATGIVDLVEHRVTGYLAEPYEAKGLADGIEWCLENPVSGTVAREKAVREFGMEDIVKAHIEYYLQAIGAGD
jgi:glycosyltransferase involved in cell wall biosynthesis